MAATADCVVCVWGGAGEELMGSLAGVCVGVFFFFFCFFLLGPPAAGLLVGGASGAHTTIPSVSAAGADVDGGGVVSVLVGGVVCVCVRVQGHC
jgi:hypothetical protein